MTPISFALAHSLPEVVLAVGALADVCVFDPEASCAVEPAALRSRSRHTPFEGHSLPARVRWTLVGGQIAYEG